MAVELAATQALVRAASPAGIAAVVATMIRDLGGALVPARYADPEAVLPVDVSLGLSEPMLPYAEPVSIAAMRLNAVLPEFLELARLSLQRLQNGSR